MIDQKELINQLDIRDNMKDQENQITSKTIRNSTTLTIYLFYIYYFIDIYTKVVRGRKKGTEVHGIPDDIDCQLLLKAWKKLFHCTCAIKEDQKTKEQYISLNGDHRQNIHEFLIKEGIGTEENIKMHGADV